MMSAVKNKNVRIRTIIIGVFFSIMYTVIGAKAIYLQVFCKSWLSLKAAGEYEGSLITYGKRGTIYDRNYSELAGSINAVSIAAYPALIKDKKGLSKSLSHTLGINCRELTRKFSSKHSFVWIKRHVTPKVVRSIKDLQFDGLDYIPEHSRIYPNKTLAAQILGLAGIDGDGLEGIEFYYDSDLKGGVVRLKVIKDAHGRVFDAEKHNKASYSGKNLILTIDRTIQFIAENALEEAAREFKPKSGIAIVMDPNTGAVLALAHYPGFNPNAYGNFHRDAWRNRAITDPFEPGSTMKIFLAAAALESGCTSNTIFYCEDGKYSIGNNLVHDTHSYDWLSLQQIIKYSSNIGAVKVTESIGKKTLYAALRSFGFGQKTGIDCPGETQGALAPCNRWSKIDAGAISFGQGISVSAIQLITAVSPIANGGTLYKPYIVQAITDENGRIVKKTKPQNIRRVISARTSGIVRRIMKTVTTEGGTGVNAALEGYSVCGKTGTAQKINARGGYAKNKYIASFVGFAPDEDPAISILVVIDEPRGKYYGGTVAAPIFRKILHETLNYLNLPAYRGTPQKITACNRSVSPKLPAGNKDKV